nr:MAG: internal scaffolding protein [Microviridae sp.]
MGKRVQLICNDPSRTHQSFSAECNINNIIKKYKKSGVLTHVTSQVASYGDYSAVPDFHEAMNIVAKAQQDFDLLPALVRKRFANDPAQFLDAVGNPDNFDEMKELGLLNSDAVKPDDLLVKNQTSEASSTSPT